MFQNLCSFCYICGKEFDFFELQFHQCPMFDSNKIADKVQDVLIDLTEESPTIDTTTNEEQSDLNKTSDSEATQTLTEQDHSTSNDNTPSQLLLPSTTPTTCIDLTDGSDDAIETNTERSLVVNENNLIEDVVLPNNANNSDDDVNMAYNELNEVIQRINDTEGSLHGATVNLVKNVSLQNDETNIRHVEDKILPRKSINIISPVSVCPQIELKIVMNSDDKSVDGGAFFELSTEKDDAQNSTPNLDSSGDVAHTRGKETDALIENELSSVNEEVSETIILGEINEGVSDAPAQIIDEASVYQSSSGIEGFDMSTLRGSDQETSICLRLPTRPAAYLLCPHCDIILENDNTLKMHQEFNHKEKLTSSTAYRGTVKGGKQCQAKESIIEAISETEHQLCNNDKGNKENRSFNSDASSKDLLKSTLEFFKYCEDQNKSTKNSNLESRDDDIKMESTGHEKGHIDDNDAESSAANKKADLIKILENSVDNLSAHESINLSKSTKTSNLMDTMESNNIAKDDVSTYTEKNRGSREASSKPIEQLNEIKKSVSKAGSTKEHEEGINKSTEPTNKNNSIVESNAISNDEATVQQLNEESSISDKVTLVTKDLNLKPKAVDVHCSTSDKNHRKYKENKVAKNNKVVSKTKLKKKHNVSNLNVNKDKDNTRKSHKKAVNKDDKLKNPMRVIKDCDIFSVSDEKTTSRQDLEDSKSKESHKKIKKTITIDQYKRQRLSITRKTIDENCQSDDGNLTTSERRLSFTEHIPVTPAAGFSHQEMEIIHEVNQWLSDYQHESNSDAAQFSDEPDINEEYEQETATSIFCEACGLKTPNRESLTNHMNELHPGFSFKCFVCDVACHSLDALINHLTKYAKSVLVRAESQFLRQRKSGPNQPYPYYCGLCGAGFTLIQLSMIHKRDCKGSSRKKSSKITKSTCKPIDDVVKSQSSYSSEEFIEDTRDQEDRCAESPSPTFLEYCEFCGEKHKNLADKQKHLHIDTFKCVICRQHFEDLDQLARHYDLCHPKHDVINHEKTEYSIQKDFKYFCKFCGNIYYFISDLLSHKEVFHYDLVHGKSDPKNEHPSLALEKIFEKPEKIPGLGDDDEVITVVESPSKANEVNHQVIDIDQENETNEKIVSTDPVDIFDVDSDADTVKVDLEDDNSSEPLQKDPSEIFLDVHEYLKKQNFYMGTDVNDELIDTITLSSSEEDRWDEAANQLANVLSDEYLLEDFDESPEAVQISPSSNAPPLIEKPNDSQIFCEVCGYECYNHEALSIHNTNNHNGFRCSLCGVRSKDIAALIQHQDQHQLESLQHAEEYTYSRMINGNVGFYRYYCSSCGQGHKYITEMKVHKTSTCLRIPKGFSSPKSPQISNENVSSIEVKEVVKPITKTTTPSNAPPLIEQPNDSQIFCEVCGYECYNHEALSIHNTNNHNGFRCSLCGVHSKDIAALIQHQDQHQLESLQDAEENIYSRMLNGNVGFYRYYCSSCGQGHKYITEMKIHKSSMCSAISKSSSPPKSPQISNENIKCASEAKEVVKPTTKTKKTIICPHCHQAFDYWHLLNEHRAKGCSAAQAASQESTSCLLNAIKNNSQQVPTTAVVDNEIKATNDSTNDNKDSTNDHKPEQHRLKKRKPTLQLYVPPKKLSQNWQMKKARKTFPCHVCRNKLFVCEAALQQHSKTSAKHIKLLKDVKISSVDGEKGEPLTARIVRNEKNIASERRSTFKSPRTSSTQSKNLKKRKGRRSRSRSGGRDTTKRRRSNDSSSNSVSRNNDKNRSKVKNNANEEILDGIYSLEDAKKLCS